MHKNLFKQIICRTKFSKKLNKRNFFTQIPEYERGIKLSGGKIKSEIGPGIHWNIPFYHQILTLNTREKIKTIPTMKLISTDGITFKINAAYQYRYVDTKKALLNVEDVGNCLLEKCKMNLLKKLTSMPMQDILNQQAEMSMSIVKDMETLKDKWGVDIYAVQVNNIEVDETMKQPMAITAIANKQADAKIIDSKSDIETAKNHKQAAEIYSTDPCAMKLREFYNWKIISQNPNNLNMLLSSLTEKIKSA